MAELRWNTLHGEWVVTSTGRPRSGGASVGICPLCTAVGGATEFDIAVVEDPMGALRPEPADPTLDGTELFQVAAARGACEIVLYGPDHGAGLVEASREKLDRVVRVWTARSAALAEHPVVRYVLVVDEREDSYGVAPAHPHGRVHAYPFVPRAAARELSRAQEHFDRYHRCLLCDLLAAELRDEQRIVVENRDFVAFAPFAARWPYEVQIVSRRHTQSLVGLDRDELRSLAAILRSVLVAYRGLFSDPLSYVMTVHQEPTDGREYYYYHLHIDLRAQVGFGVSQVESVAGIYRNEAPSEAAAAELRAVAPDAEWS